MKERINFDDPLWQLALLGLGCLVAHLLALVLYSSAGSDSGKMVWIISATALLLFTFFNAMLQLKTQNSSRYLTRSLWAYIGMVLITAGLAMALSAGSAFDSESMQAIYMVITLCYVIFLIIVFLMRRIVEYAKRQDQELIEN